MIRSKADIQDGEDDESTVSQRRRELMMPAIRYLDRHTAPETLSINLTNHATRHPHSPPVNEISVALVMIHKI